MSVINKTPHDLECRICLIRCANRVILSDQNGWFQIFEFCFGISLSNEDTPRNLCQQCADDVNKYYKLKELCLKTHKYWKSISNVFPDVKVEPDDSCNEEKNTDVEQYDSDGIDSADKYTNESFTKNTPADGDKRIKSELLESETKLNLKTNYNTSKTIFTCKRCRRNYGSKLWYMKHLKMCKLKRMKQSAACSENKSGVHLQENNKVLGSGKISERSQEILNICGICEFTPDDSKDVLRHLDEHWLNNDLQCRMCEFSGKDQAAIAAHRYAHYATKTLNFVCHICQKKTRAQLSLQFHYRKVHLNKVGGLCSQPRCDKEYTSLRLWKRHERLHNHPGYICDVCGQRFRYKHTISQHLGEHLNPSSHVCEVCGRTFRRLRGLRLHIANVHVKSKRVKCFHCSRTFKSKDYLRKHQRMLNMKKIWKCEFCPMEYPIESCLKSHLISHSDERPYCCHICGMSYKAKCVLVIHMRNHTGERPFKCTVCEKAFKSSSLLRIHKMVHTGDLPHKCWHCEKSFRSKYLLMKHCNIRHKSLPVVANKD